MLKLEYGDIDSARLAHLNLIQDVVNRLEGNAFAFKAISITLASAIIAFAGSAKNANIFIPLVAWLPVVILWLMEARYIQLGRSFRCLFDAVRRDQVSEAFTMDYVPHAEKVQGILRIALSWSVSWFYCTTLASLLIVAMILHRAGV